MNKQQTLELSLRPSRALAIPHFISSKLATDWYQRILAHKHLWRFTIDHYVLGIAYYAELESGDVARYHESAASANATVDLVLPEFRAAMSQGCRFLWNPTNEQIPAYPRSIGGAKYWSHGGVTINDTEGDLDGLESLDHFGKGHIDSEGLVPYPHLMLSKETMMYSACLSIAAPEAGGGLYVWENERHTGYDRDLTPPTDLTYFRYDPGTLILFDSFLWHQIERVTTSAERQHRVVGVMHFLYLAHPFPHWEFWY